MEKIYSVEEYLEKHEQWNDYLVLLRSILLSNGLVEEIKWSIPTYTHKKKNVVGLGAFKNHVAIWFFSGSLLVDRDNVLINAQEGKTKGLRQLRFDDISKIKKPQIDDLVQQAMLLVDQGITIKPEKKPLIIPPELQEALDKDTKLKAIFETFKLTRKREYCDYITQAKRKETKMKRLEKIIPMMFEDKGLYDKYKNC